MTIKGFLGLLKQDVLAGNVELMEQDILQIQDATDKMARLLDELLELSRIGRLIHPPEAVPLTTLAREAIQLIAGQIAERGVVVTVVPEMPVVYGDRLRLLEVLQNLLENAIKFMGEAPEPRVEIGALQEQEQVVCFVRDNGMGIQPRYHKKIFGLFDRLDQRVDGTGIGLSLVQRIVEVHGGKVWVESEGLGQGATFYFTVPR